MSKELCQLASKLLQITSEIGNVESDGHNKHQNFKFVSHQQMTAILRKKLIEHNLIILPTVKSYEEKSFPTKSGTQNVRTIVTMNFQIIDIETGFSINQQFTGADQDTSGKSMGQAITECVKRFQFKQFFVNDKNEIDPDSKGEDVTTEEQAKTQIGKEIRCLYPEASEEKQASFTDYLNGRKLHDLSLDELFKAKGVLK